MGLQQQPLLILLQRLQIPIHSLIHLRRVLLLEAIIHLSLPLLDLQILQIPRQQIRNRQIR